MKYILSLSFCLILFCSYAQTTESNWFTDKSAAMEYANNNNAQILMVFAGSDWCRPCIKFKKDILESTEFKAYADGKLGILYLDFPSKKKNKLSKEETSHNEALAAKFNTSGIFPKVVLMDQNMNKINDISYKGQSVDDFLSNLK